MLNAMINTTAICCWLHKNNSSRKQAEALSSKFFLFQCQFWISFSSGVVSVVITDVIKSITHMMSEFINAVKDGDINLTRQYLSAGIDVNQTEPQNGTTALYWAACTGNLWLCQQLIDHQADVNMSASHWGSRPLHAAADRGHRDCAQLLLKSGADINIQSLTNYDTPLHKAAYRGHYDTCRLLLKNGARTDIKNADRKTARQEAATQQHKRIYELIHDHEYNNKEQFREKNTPATEVHHHHRPPFPKAPVTSPVLRDHGANGSKVQQWNSYDDTGHPNQIPFQNSAATNNGDDQNVLYPGLTKSSNNKMKEASESIDRANRVYQDAPSVELQSLSPYVSVETNGMPSAKMHYFHVSNRKQSNENTQVSNGSVSISAGVSCESGHPDPHVVNSSDRQSNGQSYAAGQLRHNQQSNEMKKMKVMNDKLKKLENYIEQLQIALSRSKDKISELKIENEQLHKMRQSYADLEEQLRRAKEEIIHQYTRAQTSSYELKRITEQLHQMRENYKDLEREYQNEALRHANTRVTLSTPVQNQISDRYEDSSLRMYPNSGLSTDVSGSWYPSSHTLSRSSNQDNDTDNGSSQLPSTPKSSVSLYLGRGTPDSQRSPEHSDESKSSSPTPSPPLAPASSTDDVSQGSPRLPSQQLPQPTTNPNTSGVIHSPLFQALTPVFTNAGKEFMDMLTSTLLFQMGAQSQHAAVSTGSTRESKSIWNPDTDYQIDPLTQVIMKIPKQPWNVSCVHLDISQNDNPYILTVYDVISSKYSDFLDNRLAMLHSFHATFPTHRNISSILHGFRTQIHPKLSTIITKTVPHTHGLSINGTRWHTIKQKYPANLKEFISFHQRKHASPVDILPERFMYQLLYGVLSGVCFLRDHGLVMSQLSMESIALDCDLHPVLTDLHMVLPLCDGSDTQTTSLLSQTTRHSTQSTAGSDPPELQQLTYAFDELYTAKTSMSEFFTSGDVFMVAMIFFSIICTGWHGMATAGASAMQQSSQTDILDKCLKKFSPQFSKLLNLLTWMTHKERRCRPSVKMAKIRTGMLLFGPEKGELKNYSECQVWHQTKMMKMLLLSPKAEHHSNVRCMDRVRTIASSVLQTDGVLEREYILSLSPSELWQTYKATHLDTPAAPPQEKPPSTTSVT